MDKFHSKTDQGTRRHLVDQPSGDGALTSTAGSLSTAKARHNVRMICDRYEQLRKNRRDAVRQWSTAVREPKWSLDAARHLHEVYAERDEAMELLGQHMGTCPVCANIEDSQVRTAQRSSASGDCEYLLDGLAWRPQRYNENLVNHAQQCTPSDLPEELSRRVLLPRG
jgi:hypothetical protein